MGDQRALFLEEPLWKSLPWAREAKNTGDRLMDILVDLPGIAERATRPRYHAKVQSDLIDAVCRLGAWRWSWETEHPGAARVSPLKAKGAGRDAIAGAVSDIEFDTLEQAFEILEYDAALLYIIMIQRLLRHGDADTAASGPQICWPETERWGICSDDGSSPLLLPGQPTTVPALLDEALRIMPYIMESAKTSAERLPMADVASFGIIFCSAQGQPEQDRYLEWMSRFQPFEDGPREFGVFVPRTEEERRLLVGDHGAPWWEARLGRGPGVEPGHGMHHAF